MVRISVPKIAAPKTTANCPNNTLPDRSNAAKVPPQTISRKPQTSNDMVERWANLSMSSARRTSPAAMLATQVQPTVDDQAYWNFGLSNNLIAPIESSAKRNRPARFRTFKSKETPPRNTAATPK